MMKVARIYENEGMIAGYIVIEWSAKAGQIYPLPAKSYHLWLGPALPIWT